MGNDGERVPTLRAASTETLGRQADRYENLALLYRRLAVRRPAVRTPAKT